jgi:hypothetical protein
MRTISIILSVLLFLCSCEKVVYTIDLDVKEPKLVLQGFLDVDSNLVVYLTSSQSSLSPDTISEIWNGLIGIYDESENVVHDFIHQRNGFYRSNGNNLIAKEQYVIRAQAASYSPVEVNFVIPSKVEMLEIDTLRELSSRENEWGEIENNEVYKFSVTIKDDPMPGDYYTIRLLKNTYRYILDKDFYKQDSVLIKEDMFLRSFDISAELGIDDIWINIKRNNEVSGNRGICYSDAYLTGEEKVFSFEANFIEFDAEVKTGFSQYYLVVEHITKDYYTFLKSLGLYQDSQGNPFAQKVSVYTNVLGGFGIIGAYNSSIDSISIKNSLTD